MLIPLKRKILSADRVLIDVDLLSLNKNEKFNLVDGDIIEFFKISDQIARSVIINGAVKRPGVYSYYKGMKVKDLVSKADGILGTTYKQKAEITRINNDNSQTLINLNLSAALNNDPDNNIILNENDAIEILTSKRCYSRIMLRLWDTWKILVLRILKRHESF